METKDRSKQKISLAQRIKQNAMPFNLGLTVAAVIANFLFLIIMSNVNTYSTLSKGIFIVINIIVLLVLLGLDAIIFFFIKTKMVRLFQIGCALLAILLVISIPGTYISSRVNSSVSKLVNTSGTETQSVTTSIVVYGNDVKDLNELNGGMVGIVPETTYATKALEQLENEGITVTPVEYDSFTTLLLALMGEEVEAAALPGNYQSMYGNDAAFQENIDNFHSLLDFETVVKTEVKNNSEKDLTTEPFSVLILGNADGNTDSIIVASFNPVSLTLTMHSIARDSWVPICGKGSNKINAAYSYGGVSCVMQTVEDLLDIEIDFYFMANFQGVVDIVDALGGITVYSPYTFMAQNSSSERGHYSVQIFEGENELDGEQALAFARERHLYATGDFQRQINQQTVIQAILTKALRVRDLNTMLNILDAAGENIETNITQDQLIGLFNYIMKKIDRWGYTEEHPEQIINIIGSRVTGYNSSVWSDAAGLALSIVVPYQGSIEDNRETFLRNMWQDTTLSGQTAMVFDSTYEFVAPTVSNETYSEAIVQSQTPPSYWCQVTGGTYADGACACPAGTQFISEKGCQAVTTDFTQLYDQTSCNAAGGKWTADTGTCSSACSGGYIESTVGVCTINTCSASNPSGCLDQTACEAAGNEWTGSYCKAKVSAEEQCKIDGKYWYNNACHDQAQNACSSSNLSGCTDQNACTTAGGQWDSTNKKCTTKASNTPDSKCTLDGTCDSKSSCNALGGNYYSKDKTCVSSCPVGTTAKDGECVVNTSTPSPTPSTPSCPAYSICANNDGKVTGCVDGYELVNGACQIKQEIPSCTAPENGYCDSAGKPQCNQGYTMVNGACVVSCTAPENGSCDASGNPQCNNGFKLENGVCVPVNNCSVDNPSACADQGSCESFGNYWNGSSCEKKVVCPANGVCDGNSGKLTSCNEGYTLDVATNSCIQNTNTPESSEPVNTESTLYFANSLMTTLSYQSKLVNAKTMGASYKTIDFTKIAHINFN